MCFPQQKFSKICANGLGVNVSNQEGFTPLHMAALHGHSELVSLLLRHGASASAKNSQLAAPLHLACQRGHTQVTLPWHEPRCHLAPTESCLAKSATRSRENEFGGSGFCFWCLNLQMERGTLSWNHFSRHLFFIKAYMTYINIYDLCI